MEQKGNDDEGILGFLAEEIQKELRRGKRLVHMSEYQLETVIIILVLIHLNKYIINSYTCVCRI